jgi:hypothetical protein
MKRLIALFLSGLCCAVCAFSLDFGLLLDQRLEFNRDALSALPSDSSSASLSYNSGAAPWLSVGISEKAQFYFAGNISFKYAEDAWAKPLPLLELSRLELDYRPSSRTLFKAGRFGFSDSSGLIASGSFDGLYGELQTALGSVALGLWYTGLIFKETAGISMTGSDLADYHSPWDWGEINNYFAPRRLLTDLRWDIPGLLGPLNVLTLEGFAQFDLSDHGDTLHSQYLEARYVFFPVSALQISAGAIAELLEGGGEYGIALAAFAEAGVRLPGSINHRLSLGADFSSGNWNETFTAFAPLSGHPAGMLFTQKLSSLARLSLGYKARLIEALSLDMGARYFIRTDSGTPAESAGTNAGEGPEAGVVFYGGEIYASVLWAPLDDITLTLGGGAFFPGLGNVASGADIGWKFMAGLILSF